MIHNLTVRERSCNQISIVITTSIVLKRFKTEGDNFLFLVTVDGTWARYYEAKTMLKVVSR